VRNLGGTLAIVLAGHDETPVGPSEGLRELPLRLALWRAHDAPTHRLALTRDMRETQCKETLGGLDVCWVLRQKIISATSKSRTNLDDLLAIGGPQGAVASPLHALPEVGE